MDLRAAVDAPVTLRPGERASIPAGIAIALPAGFECQIRPRSGLAAHHGIGLVNAPGTIDEDYRGEIHILLVNHGSESFVVERGARIAQAVFARYERISLNQVEALSQSPRGEAGFGSTGIAD